MEETRLEWLASAKKRNLSPNIIDILSRPTTVGDLRTAEEVWEKVDQEAANLGVHPFEYLAPVSEEMRDISRKMIEGELARKITTK